MHRTLSGGYKHGDYTIEQVWIPKWKEYTWTVFKGSKRIESWPYLKLAKAKVLELEKKV